MKNIAKFSSLIFLGMVYVGSILSLIALSGPLINSFTLLWPSLVVIACFILLITVSLITITSKIIKYLMNSERTIPSRLLEAGVEQPGEINGYFITNKDINSILLSLKQISGFGSIEFHTQEDGHILTGHITYLEYREESDQWYVEFYSIARKKAYRVAVHSSDKFIIQFAKI